MTFQYNTVYRLIYKFGNIPATLAILFYIVSMLSPSKVMHQIYAGIILLFLIAVNRYFLYLWRTIPYKIEIRGTDIVLSSYVFSKKTDTISVKDITDLKGGLFDGRLGGLIRVYTGTKHARFAFFIKINNSRALQDYLLANVNQTLYNRIMNRLGLQNK